MIGDNSALPTLDMVSRTVTLHAGDQVTSSGNGGLLPAGLPIGTVMPNSAGGWRVALLADAAASQDVEILNFSKPPEEPPASAQLPAEAAGLKPQAPPPPPSATVPATAVPPVAAVPPNNLPAKPDPNSVATAPLRAPANAPAEDVDR
jgi:rod shape-determining protein MreC